MLAGGLIGAVLAYVFQAVGTRLLGDVGFAPIAAIWTAFFIVASVFLVPLEQYVTRGTSRGRSLRSDLRVVAVVAALAPVAGALDLLGAVPANRQGRDGPGAVPPVRSRRRRRRGRAGHGRRHRVRVDRPRLGHLRGKPGVPGGDGSRGGRVRGLVQRQGGAGG